MRRSDARWIVPTASVGLLAGATALALVVWGLPHLRPPAEQATLLAGSDDGGGGVFKSRPSPLASPPPIARPPSPTSLTQPMVDADPLPDLRHRHLELPVRGAVRRELHDSFFDTRRSTHNHEAIDIMAPRHTPVLAVEDGTIARLFESKAGGTTVYQFEKTTRYVYYYAHLQRYAEGLREGDRVQRGQVLGYVGTSGNAPEGTPHLHFAIFRLTDKKQWWQGSPIDPYDVFK